MGKPLKASTEGLSEPETSEVAPAPSAGTAVAKSDPETQHVEDGSFPSPHIVYLGVVRNELEAQSLRFRNGLEMLQAKLGGEQASFEDDIKTLTEEFERKKKERQDAHLSNVTRLKVQIGDIHDVIETYDAAMGKVTDILDRQTAADQAAAAAVGGGTDAPSGT